MSCNLNSFQEVMQGLGLELFQVPGQRPRVHTQVQGFRSSGLLSSLNPPGARVHPPDNENSPYYILLLH